jgi:hypothetical protein
MTGPRALQRLLLALALALGMCAGCEVVAQLPVITSFPPSWDVTTTPKTLEARITQNNGPLARSLRVRCEFSFERPPTQLPNVRSVPAQRMPGTRYFCIIRPGSQLRNNHVLRFEWFVESLNSLGQAIPVARSGVQTFHVGCENPTQFLQNDQAAVLASFGAVTTRTRILLAGYIPAHPVAVPMPIPLGGEIDRVFRGMGVAFARAQDVLAAGNFAPSGLPQSGSRTSCSSCRRRPSTADRIWRIPERHIG